MRNKKFWEDNPNSELWKQAKRFVEENDKTCGLSDVEQSEYVKELIEFIELNKKAIADEYNMEWWREDVYSELKERFGEFGGNLYDAIPLKSIDLLILEWRDEVEENESCCDGVNSELDMALKERSWYADYKDYTDDQKELYLVYLEDWYSSHEAEWPVCIAEFLNNEMKDEELSAYYKQLLEDKKSGKAQEKRQAELIEAIVNRAALLGFLKMERCVAVEVMKLATEHYKLDLEAMWNGSDFDFLHDFVQIPQHFHPREGFDNKFLPRFSKRSLE